MDDDKIIVVTISGDNKPQTIDSIYKVYWSADKFEVLCRDSTFGSIETDLAVKIYRERPEIIDDKAKEKISEIIKDDEITDVQESYPVLDWLSERPFNPVKWVEGND